eukprot:maker-scaffold23_size669530-snap-gene-2.12 protein:Tk11065 transcript:maker-scaffold23_size669530-snap-gene-2.12-mRNA-1 annotation:"isoform b"
MNAAPVSRIRASERASKATTASDMAFMLKKKRYKFQVDLCLEELSEVSYSKAIMFAKVRQLEGGSFVATSKRMEVQNHRVEYDAKFDFPCKMSASASSGILDSSKCRISIRLEEKGGRNFRKLGFSDINLAEYAGAGPCTQRYILQPYDQNHRLDNSILQISLNITLKEGDTIFQRPLTRQQPISLPGEERLSGSTLNLAASVPPGTTGNGQSGTQLGPVPPPGSTSQLTIPGPQQLSSGSNRKTLGKDLVKPPPGCSLGSSQDTPPASLTLASIGVLPPSSGSSSTGLGPAQGVPPTSGSQENEQSHTRNSSTTSQASAGYGSTVSGGQPTHSRQSSSGDSTHGRNLSQGSSDTGFFGSMEKEKRRKQKLDEGRRDPESVINELMEGVDFDKAAKEDAETSGLQLYVCKDGTVTFDKNSSSRRDFNPVVIPSEPR